MSRPAARRPVQLSRALLALETAQQKGRELRTALYSAAVPDSTFAAVRDVPQVIFRRFTPCGRYLIAFDRNLRDIIVFRFEAGGRRQVPYLSHPSVSKSSIDFDVLAFRPVPPDPDQCAVHMRSFNTAGAHLLPAAPPYPTNNHVPPPVCVNHPNPFLPDPHNHNLIDNNAQINNNNNRTQTPQPTTPESVPNSCSFNRFFTRLYRATIAAPTDTLQQDFCLATPRARYIILASFQERTTAPDPQQNPNHNNTNANGNNAPASASNVNTNPVNPPALAAAEPVLESFTLHLIDVETGQAADHFSLHDDFVVREGHGAVHMRHDRLCLLAVRRQTLHIIKVSEALGRFVVEARIGYHCAQDDELEIARVRDAEIAYRARVRAHNLKRARPSSLDLSLSHNVAPNSRFSSTNINKSDQPNTEISSNSDPSEGTNSIAGVDGNAEVGLEENATDRLPDHQQQEPTRQPPPEPPPVETGLGNGKLRSGFFTGLMQRLLVYVYRRYHREGNQAFFYRVVGQYSLLVMQKAQLLDDDHLLIRLGSFERNGKASDPSFTCFFVVYCISEAEILNLFQNNSPELLAVYEKFRDAFLHDSAVAATLPPPPPSQVTSTSAGNSVHGHSSTTEENMAAAAVAIARTSRTGTPAAGVAQGDRSFNSNGMTRWRRTRNGGVTSARSHQSRRIRAALASLPVSVQTRCVSPYLDRSLFTYNADRLPALDGTRQLPLRDMKFVKFVSTRTGLPRFKLAPGLVEGVGIPPPPSQPPTPQPPPPPPPLGIAQSALASVHQIQGNQQNSHPMPLFAAGGIPNHNAAAAAMRMRPRQVIPAPIVRVNLAARQTQNQERRRTKFLFHPYLPFVMSTEQRQSGPGVVNFHVHGHSDLHYHAVPH